MQRSSRVPIEHSSVLATGALPDCREPRFEQIVEPDEPMEPGRGGAGRRLRVRVPSARQVQQFAQISARGSRATLPSLARKSARSEPGWTFASAGANDSPFAQTHETAMPNPFVSDPDRSAIWTMLVERDIAAFTAADWGMVAEDFIEAQFLGIDGRGGDNPDGWRIGFPTLAAYRDEWLRQARE